MTIQHRPECIAQKKKLDAWVELWPDYCKRCDAQGFLTTSGTMWEPPSIDPCECLENGKCPRCAKPIEEQELTLPGHQWPEVYYVCPHCGWTDEDSPIQEPMCAPPFECYCYEDDYQYEREVKGG